MQDGASLLEICGLLVGQGHRWCWWFCLHSCTRFTCGMGIPSPFETSKARIAAGHGTVCQMWDNVNMISLWLVLIALSVFWLTGGSVFATIGAVLLAWVIIGVWNSNGT